MSTDVVTTSVDADVAVISVDNPPVNTINAAVRAGLFAAIAGIRARTDIRAVVLLCEGRTFFSGADISEFSGPPKEAECRDLFRQLEDLPMSVVAGMHGVVMGGGLEIALACHYRVAAPGTRFGLPEVTLGVIPGAGGTQRMPRLIGVEKTLELILAATPVDVAAGISLGFIDAEIEGDVRAGERRLRESAAARGGRPASHQRARRRRRNGDAGNHRTAPQPGEEAVPESAGGAHRHRGRCRGRDAALRGGAAA